MRRMNINGARRAGRVPVNSGCRHPLGIAPLQEVRGNADNSRRYYGHHPLPANQTLHKHMTDVNVTVLAVTGQL